LLGLLLVSAAAPAQAVPPDQSGVTLTVRIAPQPGCAGGQGCPKEGLAGTGIDASGLLAAGAVMAGCGTLMLTRRRRSVVHP